MDFLGIIHLASTGALLLAAHGCLGISWELPGRPWQLLAAPGGSITSFSIILMSHHMLAMYLHIRHVWLFAT